MSNTQKAHSIQASAGNPMHCPVEHGSLSYQKTSRNAGASPETSSTPLQRDAQGVWQVHGFEEARTILRSSATRQPGSNPSQLERFLALRIKPILNLKAKPNRKSANKTPLSLLPKPSSPATRQSMK